MAVKSRQDYYLQHPEALKGQPKTAIGDYVEQNGILVPRRFASLSEARASGVEVIVRSEDQQDYAGSSGILDSPLLSKYPDVTGEAKLRERLLGREEGKGDSDNAQVRLHYQLLGMSRQEFLEGVSYSYWEHMPGYRRAVVADSAIEGRYHIVTKGEDALCLTVVDHGNATTLTNIALPKILEPGIPALIETYEAVRNLGRFDSNHAPIMEFVTHNGRDYFLQYHRSRDFEAATFTLERAPSVGEVSALFVRGATPLDGITCNVTHHYSWEYTGNQKLPEEEDGSYDHHYMSSFSEIMVRRRRVQLFEVTRPDFRSWLAKNLDHSSFSKLMKPEVSAIHRMGELMSDQEVEQLSRRAYAGEPQVGIEINIVSDGNIAILRRA